jgi:hypothetical protein
MTAEKRADWIQANDETNLTQSGGDVFHFRRKTGKNEGFIQASFSKNLGGGKNVFFFSFRHHHFHQFTQGFAIH